MICLTDSEIIEWNIEQNFNIGVSPLYNSHKNYPNISITFYEKPPEWSIYSSPHSTVINTIPNINFNYSFSIMKDSLNFYNYIKKKVFGNLIVENLVFIDKEKSERIELDMLNTNFTQHEHQVNDISYFRQNYEFSGKITNIFAYYTLLKRCLKLMQTYWCIENNTPKELSKFKINDLVTDINGVEYIIIDYDTKNLHDISYITQEVLYNNSYIEYGNKKYTFFEKNLKWSRDNRINQIIS